MRRSLNQMTTMSTTSLLKIAGGFLLACIALSAIVLLGQLNAESDLCSLTILREAPSPNGKLRAMVFTQDCGATTGYSTQVSLLESGEDPSSRDGGNLFIADDNHGSAPTQPGQGPTVNVAWLSDGKLRIQHHALARIFKSAPALKNVQVDYSAFN